MRRTPLESGRGRLRRGNQDVASSRSLDGSLTVGVDGDNRSGACIGTAAFDDPGSRAGFMCATGGTGATFDDLLGGGAGIAAGFIETDRRSPHGRCSEAIKVRKDLQKEVEKIDKGLVSVGVETRSISKMLGSRNRECAPASKKPCMSTRQSILGFSNGKKSLGRCGLGSATNGRPGPSMRGKAKCRQG